MKKAMVVQCTPSYKKDSYKLIIYLKKYENRSRLIIQIITFIVLHGVFKFDYHLDYHAV